MTQTPRILVVDDNVDVADSLALLLGCAGYEVQTAYNGEQAVQMARQFDPAFVITRHQHAGHGRPDRARTLRLAQQNSAQKLRLIALTGLTHPSDRAEAMESGFDMILPKPIEGSQMRQMVDSVLGGPLPLPD